MSCFLFATLALTALPPDALATESTRATTSGPGRSLGNASAAAVHLSVRPMAAPQPALRYQLLPELRELNPGNAAHNYLKCFMEQRRFFYSKEAVADRCRYLALPLAELPLD